MKGGKREGAGAPKKPDHLIAKHRSIRVNDERWAKFNLIGSMKWLNKMIDEFQL